MSSHLENIQNYLKLARERVEECNHELEQNAADLFRIQKVIYKTRLSIKLAKKKIWPNNLYLVRPEEEEEILEYLLDEKIRLRECHREKRVCIELRAKWLNKRTHYLNRISGLTNGIC